RGVGGRALEPGRDGTGGFRYGGDCRRVGARARLRRRARPRFSGALYRPGQRRPHSAGDLLSGAERLCRRAAVYRPLEDADGQDGRHGDPFARALLQRAGRQCAGDAARRTLEQPALRGVSQDLTGCRRHAARLRPLLRHHREEGAPSPGPSPTGRGERNIHIHPHPQPFSLEGRREPNGHACAVAPPPQRGTSDRGRKGRPESFRNQTALAVGTGGGSRNRAMPDILLTHGYYLYEDEKERQIMKPYPPLGLLYLSAYLKRAGFSVGLYDSTLGCRPELLARLATEPGGVLGIYTNLMTRANVLDIV